MLNMKPRLATGIKDRWIWDLDASGLYTTKSAHRWLSSENGQVHSEESWRWVWKLQVPANIQFFLWQLCHLALPTRAVLGSRGIPVDARCGLCNAHVETIHHCLFSCGHWRGVWQRCLHQYMHLPDEDFEPLNWLRNTSSKTGTLILVVMWKVWCAVNRFVFDNVDTHINDVVEGSLVLHQQILNAYNHSGGELKTRVDAREVMWSKPPLDYVALNVDGSAITNPRQAGFSGLIRDHRGEFRRGFYGSIGYSDIMPAELMVIFHGISLCWELGLRKIICFIDSLNTMKLLSEGDQNYHRHGNEIALVRAMLQRGWEVQLHHTLKEGNQAADYLAKRGPRSSSSLPSWILLHLEWIPFF